MRALSYYRAEAILPATPRHAQRMQGIPFVMPSACRASVLRFPDSGRQKPDLRRLLRIPSFGPQRTAGLLTTTVLQPSDHHSPCHARREAPPPARRLLRFSNHCPLLLTKPPSVSLRALPLPTKQGERERCKRISEIDCTSHIFRKQKTTFPCLPDSSPFYPLPLRRPNSAHHTPYLQRSTPSSRPQTTISYSNTYKITVGRSPEKTGHIPGQYLQTTYNQSFTKQMLEGGVWRPEKILPKK